MANECPTHQIQICIHESCSLVGFTLVLEHRAGVEGREKERPTMARRSISEEFVKRRKKREVDMKRETDRFHLRGDGRTDGCSFVFPPAI